MKQMTASFDANRMAFQRNFTSSFALNFIMIWLSGHCKMPKNGAYLERG